MARGEAISRRRRRGEPVWPITLALLVLLAIGVAALGTVLAGSGWWFAMVSVAGAVLVSNALFRRLGFGRRVVPLLGLAVFVVVMTLVFGGGTGILWLIPSPATVGRFVTVIEAGSDSIAAQGIPATVDEGILFLLVAGAGVLAILMDACALTFRLPALAGIPLLIPLAVPGLLVDGGASALALALAAAAYLVLLRIDVRLRRHTEGVGPVGRNGIGPLRGTLVVGTVGIVSALVLSSVASAFTSADLAGTRGGGLLFGSGVSPLIDIGQDLRRPDATPVLSYTTSATALPYFKLLTLDRFVGTTWTSQFPPGRTDTPVAEMTRPAALADSVETLESRTAITIQGVSTTWLPAPSPAVAVNGLSGRWYWNPRSQVITSSNSTTRGQDYTVTALQLQPTKDQLRTASTEYPETVASDLDVPSPRPDIIDQTAREVTANATSPYEIAIALQDYLRGGQFTYNTDAPVENGYDGGGVDLVGQFLEVKSGYCVHFASAMAIMARVLGIPARISIGYLPGTRAHPVGQGSNEYLVNSHDLHAWPELYFSGIGWVPFEPTPGRGTVPDYASPNVNTDQSTPQNQAAPSNVPRPQNSARDLIAPEPSAALAQAEATDSLVRVGFLGFGVFVLLWVPFLARKIRRFARRRRVAGHIDGARQAWVELSDTALDHGIVVSDTQTPRELADALRRRIDAARGDPAKVDPAKVDPAKVDVSTFDVAQVGDALNRLLVAEERARYDRPRPVGEQSAATTGHVSMERDLSDVIRAVHSSSDWRIRAAATMLPASLWPAVFGALQPSLRKRSARDA